MVAIDLNADLGEDMGDDVALLSVVSSANVACGFHAGDPVIAARTVGAATARGIAVGAHPSYRDREGFGRRFLDVAPAVLADEVLEQLAGLAEVAAASGTRVSYVKPHGALYNAIVAHDAHARAVVSAVATFSPGLAVLGLPGSLFLQLAERAGLQPVGEAFVDRAYAPDGTLVPRSVPGSVLHDPDAVAARAVRLATEGNVLAVDGSVVRVEARSLCIHGDSPGAVAMARAVHAALLGAGVDVAPFVAP